jgi:hypothetical protein
MSKDKKPKNNIDPEEEVPTEDLFIGLDQLFNDKGNASKKVRAVESIFIEEAPNAITFIESSKFLSAPKLFPVQHEIVRDLFELLCPNCNDISRIHSRNDIPQDEQVLFEYNKCPLCKEEKVKFKDKFKFYNELVAALGQRSGKSFLAACISNYILHRFLCVQNLQQELKLPKTQVLDGSFVATSAEQSEETVYGQFKRLCKESPWFSKLRKELIQLEKSNQTFKKGELYKETDTKIYFGFKRILIEAMHSNSAGQVGRTRIFAVLDELARFDLTTGKRGGDDVYRALKRSLTTVTSAVNRRRERINDYYFPTGMMINISSTMHANDKIMTLLAEAEKSPKMFAVRKRTVEVNPTITQEDLEDEYIRDPIGAARDYDSNPPGADSPFIKDPRIIEICIDTQRPSIFTYEEKHFDLNIQGVTFNYLSLDLKNISYHNLYRYVIHCDPGQSHDSFCLAIGHADKGNVIIDGALEAKPIYGRTVVPRAVHFPSMTDIIFQLKKLMTIEIVSYDRWNSAEQIDRLRHSGILAVGKNIDREDHLKFFESMQHSKVRFPKRENDSLNFRSARNAPCGKALYELRHLTDNGIKVDHIPNNSNDMIQCYVGVHRLLTNADKVISKFDMSSLNKNKLSRKTGFHPTLGKYIKLKRFM